MDFPNNRLVYTGVEGPLFDNESKNALDALYKAVNMILGLGASGFAILSGFVYTSGSPGHYTGGLVWIDDVIYYCPGGINVGQYLVPGTSGVEYKPHKDGINRNTYQIFYAVASDGYGASPQFTTNMDSYRWDMSYVKSQAITSAKSYTDGLRIYDVGNPSSYDMDFGTPNPSTWADWDLSYIIPIGTKAVLLRVHIDPTNPVNSIILVKGANDFEINAANCVGDITNVVQVDVWVAVSSSRKLSYKKTGTGNISILVAMWL